VATNAGTGYMNHILDYFEIRPMFAEARCAGAEGTSDKSQLIELIVGSLSVAPSEAVMVGDRASDVSGARRAGTRAIGCTWGFGTPEELGDADILVDSFEELGMAVERLSSM